MSLATVNIARHDLSIHQNTRHQLPADKSIIGNAAVGKDRCAWRRRYSGYSGESCLVIKTSGQSQLRIPYNVRSTLQCVCVSPAIAPMDRRTGTSSLTKTSKIVLPRRKHKKPAQLVCAAKKPCLPVSACILLRATHQNAATHQVHSIVLLSKGAPAVESFHSTCMRDLH